MEQTTDQTPAAGGAHELLPVLASLDSLTTAMQDQQQTGEGLTDAQVADYDAQSQHARHLVLTHAVTAEDLQDAARDHQGDGEHGFETHALAHALALAPQAWSTETPTAHLDEEIDL